MLLSALVMYPFLVSKCVSSKNESINGYTAEIENVLSSWSDFLEDFGEYSLILKLMYYKYIYK